MPVLIGGSRRFVPAAAGGEQLGPGVRASPGTVGYLGDLGDLTTMSSGTAPAGTSWDSGDQVLIVTGANVILDHFLINGSIVHSAGTLTVTNCRIIGVPFWGIDTTGTSLTVTDTTVIGPNALVGGLKPVIAISGAATGMTIRRCDLSGYGDGVQCGGATLISQCYIHDPALVSDLHCDGVQYTSGGTGLTVEHCHIDIKSPGGEAAVDNGVGGGQNAAVAVSDDTPPMINAVVHDNYLMGGGYYLRVENGAVNTTVTDNDFGPLTAGAFDEISVSDPTDIGTWSGNRTNDGILIPQP